MSLWKAVLADPHELSRAALRQALEHAGHVRVVGGAASTAEATEMVRRHQPDLLLLTHGHAELDVPKLCEVAKAEAHAPSVVVCGDLRSQHVLREAVSAGADGYVSKDMPLGAMVAAVHQVLNGESYVPPSMLSALLRGLIEHNRMSQRVLQLFAKLTRREREVLALLVEGCDHTTVADILVISPQTARTHIQNVISKLGVHSRLEAAALAVEHGLLERLSVGGRT